MGKYRIWKVATAAFAMLAIVVSLDCKQAKAQSRDIAADWIAAWSSHDPDAVVAVFTADVFYEDVTLGLVDHGSGELRALAQSFFTAVPDVHFDLVATILRQLGLLPPE
jgi:ketosteroid isomerase-like protein